MKQLGKGFLCLALSSTVNKFTQIFQGGYSWVSKIVLIMVAIMVLAGIVMVLDGLQELAKHNERFNKLRKWYVGYLFFGFLLGLVLLIASFAFIATISSSEETGDESSLTKPTVAVLVFFTVLVIAANVLIFIWESLMLKGIRELGGGCKIGFKALQISWIIWTASRLFSVVYAVVRMINKLNQIENIEQLNSAETGSVIIGFMSLAGNLLFALCLIRVGTYLEPRLPKPNKEEQPSN